MARRAPRARKRERGSGQGDGATAQGARLRAMSGVVNSVAYADGRRIADVPLDDIGEGLEVPGHFAWIGLHEPSEELLAKIQHEFGLHELAVEDAARAHQRPKLGEYGTCLFVVLRISSSAPTTSDR